MVIHDILTGIDTLIPDDSTVRVRVAPGKYIEVCQDPGDPNRLRINTTYGIIDARPVAANVITIGAVK